MTKRTRRAPPNLQLEDADRIFSTPLFIAIGDAQYRAHDIAPLPASGRMIRYADAVKRRFKNMVSVQICMEVSSEGTRYLVRRPRNRTAWYLDELIESLEPMMLGEVCWRESGTFMFERSEDSEMLIALLSQ